MFTHAFSLSPFLTNNTVPLSLGKNDLVFKNEMLHECWISWMSQHYPWHRNIPLEQSVLPSGLNDSWGYPGELTTTYLLSFLQSEQDVYMCRNYIILSLQIHYQACVQLHCLYSSVPPKRFWGLPREHLSVAINKTNKPAMGSRAWLTLHYEFLARKKIFSPSAFISQQSAKPAATLTWCSLASSIREVCILLLGV